MDLTGIQLSGNKMTFYNKQKNTSSVIWVSKEQTESTKQGGVWRYCIFCLKVKEARAQKIGLKSTYLKIWFI